MDGQENERERRERESVGKSEVAKESPDKSLC